MEEKETRLVVQQELVENKCLVTGDYKDASFITNKQYEEKWVINDRNQHIK